MSKTGIDLKELAALVIRTAVAIEKDAGASERLRAGARALPPNEAKRALGIIEMAEFVAKAESKPVAKPRAYRKGTGRRVVSWADCPWRPAQ